MVYDILGIHDWSNSEGLSATPGSRLPVQRRNVRRGSPSGTECCADNAARLREGGEARGILLKIAKLLIYS